MGIIDQIMDMQRQMGEYAELDLASDLDEFEDWMHELSTNELHDTYSYVNARYESWLKGQKENATG